MHAPCRTLRALRCWFAARDTRREGQLVGGTNKKHMVKYEVDVSEGLQVGCKA